MTMSDEYEFESVALPAAIGLIPGQPRRPCDGPSGN
jgi:hypothetical protein